jgi:hypothetical protein
MDQNRDDKWRKLCETAAIEQDSKRLIELVTEIIKELDERDRRRKSGVVKKGCNESCFGMGFVREVTKHAKAAYGFDPGACSV